ncbi:hypothetical protein, partial [Halobiforma nitratireducens]|uniref:hypothetical protein n=1 Tax=Halobiforma nitratireducens TaxID=130048 RepID=UPI0012691400
MASDSATFNDLDFPRVLNTSKTDFVDEFYEPLLSRSVEYKRGVGYFTSNWIAPLRGHLILLSGVHSTVLRETCRELDA